MPAAAAPTAVGRAKAPLSEVEDEPEEVEDEPEEAEDSEELEGDPVEIVLVMVADSVAVVEPAESVRVV